MAYDTRCLAATLPPLPRRGQAADDVTMSRCRHHRSHCAAIAALPPLHCAPPPRFALPPPPLMLPPPQRRRQAATNVALSRCRHRLAATKLPPMSRFRAAATALPPLRCAPPPRCCHRRAAAKLPPTSRCRAAATA
jgi:hypothetical protein